MTSLDFPSLTQTELRRLVEAADRTDGLLILPDHLKPATRERLIGKFSAAGLVSRYATDDGISYRLTPAGYCAAGRKPPRANRSVAAAPAARASASTPICPALAMSPPTDVPASAISTLETQPSSPFPDPAGIDAGDGIEVAPITKRTLFLALLARETGASLSEIVAATGWLPHTSRAALSRLRSADQPLAKTKRPDGCTAYRLVPAKTVVPKLRRTGRAKENDGGVATTLSSSAGASAGAA